MTPQSTERSVSETSEPAPIAHWGVLGGLRGWIGTHRLFAALLIGACMAVTGGAMLAVRLVQKSSSHRHALPVEAALEALDGGRYDEARQLAEARAPRVRWKATAKGTWRSFSEH